MGVSWKDVDRQSLQEQLRHALYSVVPGEAAGLVVTPYGEQNPQGPRYFVYADVLGELIKAARYRDEAATAILTGQFGHDDKGPFVEVTGFRDLQYLYGGDPVALTLPVLCDALGREGEDTQLPTDHIVGVFAARPGSRARLEEEMARLQLSLFNLPHQLLLVVDGRHERLGLFARPKKGRFINPPLYLVERSGGKDESERRVQS